jgi:hypothetical protein
LALLSVLLLVQWPLHAQYLGEAVRVTAEQAEDIYAAGGTVDVYASVRGDVVAAGGRVTVTEHVSGDVMAAGGSVTVSATVDDDVRLAGGDVTVSGRVGDDAIAAGGSVTLSAPATVGGRAWLSGGRVDVAGTVGKELRASGGRILLSGTVNGDAILEGGEISILDGAVINGNLVYQSPQAAEIADGAVIGGTVTHEPVERHTGQIVAVVVGVGLVLLVSLAITGIAWFLLFPHQVSATVLRIRTSPWPSLGLGLAFFAATPVVISVLFMIVVGWLPALVVGVLYLLLLLAGFLAGIFYVASLAPGLPAQDGEPRARWIIAFLLALPVVLLLGLIPLLGGLLLFVLLLLGMGALVFGLYRQYQSQAVA